jgi:transglutaminase-like putative cysteine protease
MIYSIRLTITHHYNQPAANSRHLIRVLPINIVGRQRLARHLLDITPEPDARSDAFDFFGNMATTCAHSDQHGEMSIRLACHVEVFRPQPWLDISPSVANLRHQWGANTSLGPGSPLHFLGPTPRLAPDRAITQYVQSIFDPQQSTAANVIRFGQALHDVMTFDSTATTVDTDVS